MPGNARTARGGVILSVVNHPNACVENFDKARELAALEQMIVEPSDSCSGRIFDYFVTSRSSH